MKNQLKLKGRLRLFLNLEIFLGVILAAVNVCVYMAGKLPGMILGCFTLVYFLAVTIVYLYTKPAVINELVSFATGYGQVQKSLLKTLEIPHAILDENAEIIWNNDAFEKLVGQGRNRGRSISDILPGISAASIPEKTGDVSEENLELSEGYYRVRLRKIPLEDMLAKSSIVDAPGYEGYLAALYIFDETALSIALKEVDNRSLAVGLIYLDNYDEALDSVEEVRRSLLIALIDRKVNKYIAAIDGICKKLEKDKYLVIFHKESLHQLEEGKFELLEDVKTVNIGNDMAVTLSIGIGLDGLSLPQVYEFSRSAIELALGRGGDQAVVKTPSSTKYFGGKSQQMEKNTRVKARVKANALEEILSAKDKVFIMGHRMSDADAFGAAVGIYKIGAALGKETHIVLTEPDNFVSQLAAIFRRNPDYPEDMILTSAQAMELAGSNSALVIVDVNKPSITDCPELIHMCKSVVVLDHHRQGTEIVENATLSYVEPYASSSCEMVSEILQYVSAPIKITSDEADVMYSGIMVDTNNFVTKTGVRTFEAAAYLRRNGADVTRVRKLFREDANTYKAKADAVSQAEIFHNYYAISICIADDVPNPTVVGAQAANELLNIKGIKASFVLTEYQNVIYVSARSIDEVNVQVIMERLGGGGHMSVAACQMEQTTLAEAIRIVKNELEKMIEEGELK